MSFLRPIAFFSSLVQGFSSFFCGRERWWPLGIILGGRGWRWRVSEAWWRIAVGWCDATDMLTWFVFACFCSTVVLPCFCFLFTDLVVLHVFLAAGGRLYFRRLFWNLEVFVVGASLWNLSDQGHRNLTIERACEVGRSKHRPPLQKHSLHF